MDKERSLLDRVVKKDKKAIKDWEKKQKKEQ